MENNSTEILEEVKESLRISWEDEDNNLNRIIIKGKNRLKELTDIELTFSAESAERELLIEFCRYSYNNAAEFFEGNFQKEITRLQLKLAAESLGESESSGE